MEGEPYIEIERHRMSIAETRHERALREYATLPDPRRPKSEHYLEYFYNKLLSGSHTVNANRLPHSDLFYVRAALEDKFPDRVFTIQEVKNLIKDELGVDIFE